MKELLLENPMGMEKLFLMKANMTMKDKFIIAKLMESEFLEIIKMIISMRENGKIPNLIKEFLKFILQNVFSANFLKVNLLSKKKMKLLYKLMKRIKLAKYFILTEGDMKDKLIS